MTNSGLESLSDEKLLKNRNFLKGLTLGLVIVNVVVLAWLVYMIATNGFGEKSMIIYLAIIALPISCMPLFLKLKGLNKEVKRRNLE